MLWVALAVIAGVASMVWAAEAVARVGGAHVVSGAPFALKPSLDATSMVFVRHAHALNSVWLMDIQNGAQRMLSSPGVDAYDPDIHRDRVVWEERLGRRSVIVLHDLVTGETVRLTCTPSHAPSIWGDTVVWTCEVEFDARLIALDLTTGVRTVLARVERGTTSDLYETTLVHDDGGDIHTIDLSTGLKRTVVSGPQLSEFPSVCGTTVAYAHWGRGLSEIRLLDLDTGRSTVAVRGVGCSYAPALREGVLAWESYTVEPRIDVMIARVTVGSLAGFAAPCVAQLFTSVGEARSTEVSRILDFVRFAVITALAG